MDNRVFNVNGQGHDMLRTALKLVFEQDGKRTTAERWRIDPDKGLILFSCGEQKDSHPFPTPLNADGVLSTVWNFLNSVEAAKIKLKDWDCDEDHDGSNSLGWRVYCEDWGHVADEFHAICAITPAYMWHGK
jgi:hypothetical protein